jgi:hypothetical protein
MGPIPFPPGMIFSSFDLNGLLILWKKSYRQVPFFPPLLFPIPFPEDLPLPCPLPSRGPFEPLLDPVPSRPGLFITSYIRNSVKKKPFDRIL